MTISRVGLAFAVSVLVATPSVFAQHTSSGGGSVGSAVARGGGGGGGGDMGGGGGGGSMGTESAGGGGGRATARGGAWSHAAATRAEARGASMRGEAAGEGGARATAGFARSRYANGNASAGDVPMYSRPGAGRPPVGQAVPRGSVQSPGNNNQNINNGMGAWGYPYGLYGGYGYGGYGYGGYGYGYGMDPGFGYLYGGSMFGAYGDWEDDPNGLYGIGGVGYDPYASTQSFVPLGPNGVEEGTSNEPKKPGALRFNVKPMKAAVYVDGNYVGQVKQYDSFFKKLRLDAGPHEVQIKADGYEPATFHVRIEPGQTEVYKGELDKTKK